MSEASGVAAGGSSRKRRGALLALLALVGGLGLLGVWCWAPWVDASSAAEAALGFRQASPQGLDERFVDADGDLVADRPADPQSWVNPDPIVFSYIGNPHPERYAKVFEPLRQALAEAMGREVRYRRFTSREDQLAALANGRLHVAGLNTGAVPPAVNQAGFVPVATLGNADGIAGYQMILAVPDDSALQEVEQLRGRTLTLTGRGSNSGFKAPLVLLREQFGMRPGGDYAYQFSGSHDNSIRGLVRGRYEVIATASDLLDRFIGAGEVRPGQVRVIYASPPFPPAVLGVRHDVTPALSDTIRRTVLEFEWEGTPLMLEIGTSGADRFVPVNYRADFELVRQIGAMFSASD